MFNHRGSSGRGLWLSALLLFTGASIASEQPPTLPIGSDMPSFSLPGIDGKTYTEKSFAKADILMLVFTCVHCPTAQAYQERIKKLVTDYAPKNVTLIAINPNHADAVRLDDQRRHEVIESGGWGERRRARLVHDAHGRSDGSNADQRRRQQGCGK
jgi:hypothetical protein